MNDFYGSQSHSLFIDRDGVINKRIFNGYVRSPDEFEFLPGVLESFVRFRQLFNKIIIVTNQQGVGKGMMTERQLQEIHRLMVAQIEKAGGKVDAIYYCTDLAEKQDNCRKPNTIMADKAKADFPDIDFRKSIMVGDSESDMLFGNHAGMKTVFIGEKNSLKKVLPNAALPDLPSFANSIKTKGFIK